ncbi:MAG: metallophosphoesterase [candidate division Zixibacteria bacterium]|nr:metallophosphoesterase [candidate division Zixibacteria bacterium]
MTEPHAPSFVSAGTATPVDIFVLENETCLSPEARALHLETRRRKEAEVYHHHACTWYSRWFDAGRWLRIVLKLTGLTRWAERNMLAIDVHSHVFTFDDLPESFHGFRIMHLSDLHIDAHPGLASAVAVALREFDADVCLITGDYRFGVIESSGSLNQALATVVRNIRTQAGAIGVMGNHDTTEDADTLTDLGVRVLLNESVEIRRNGESLWVSGVDESRDFKCHDLDRALSATPNDAFSILLCHHPDLCEEAARRGVDLYLCGHTHGGQFCFPVVGPVVTKTDVPRRFVSGKWRYEEMTGYTSRGLGVSGALARMNCPPEIALIELCQTGK